jgi:hypothetical protein
LTVSGWTMARPRKTYGELNFFTVLIKLKNENDEKLVEATQLFFVRDK